MVSREDQHVLDIMAIRYGDPQTEIDNATCAAKRDALELIKRWRSLFTDQHVIRKLYRFQRDAQIDIRSGSHTHTLVSLTNDSGSWSFDLNAENDDLSVMHVNKRGKQRIVIDDFLNYSRLSRLLFECRARELDERQRADQDTR